jgi:hypothetical protein
VKAWGKNQIPFYKLKIIIGKKKLILNLGIEKGDIK